MPRKNWYVRIGRGKGIHTVRAANDTKTTCGLSLGDRSRNTTKPDNHGKICWNCWQNDPNVRAEYGK